jgi:site-specific recombinase XerD
LDFSNIIFPVFFYCLLTTSLKRGDGACKLVFVSSHLSEILTQISREFEYIIGVYNRQRNPETFRNVWNRIKSVTGINGRFYNIRHTFATQLLKNDGNIKTISALLGHSSVTTTEIYAQVVNEDKEKVIGFLPES